MQPTPDLSGALRTIWLGADERRDVEAPLIALARQSGWICFHAYSSRKSQPGFPDLVMVRVPSQHATRYGPPYVLFLECKRESGRLSVAQKAWGAALGCVEVASGGAVAYRVVRPSSRWEVEQLLVGKQEARPRLEREVIAG